MNSNFWIGLTAQNTGLYHWRSTGLAPTFDDWDQVSQNPHGGEEQCATMWTKADWRWGDWLCSTTVTGPGT